MRVLSETFSHPISDISYKVDVSIPQEEMPPEGFPVLYILDGNAYGMMFKEILKLQWRRSEKTKIFPMIIVSIGYDTSDVFLPLRVFDFTPSSSTVSLPIKSDKTPWPEHGGAEEFLYFLEKVVIPFVNENSAVDRDNQTLFGHSLGGLFVLYTLFKRSDLFNNYISCSPSIWWNDCQILQYEQINVLTQHKRLYLAVERMQKAYMYENALALYERIKVNQPHRVKFTSPEGENHMSIVPTILSEAFRFLHKP